MKNFYVTLFFLITCFFAQTCAAKNKKKPTKTSTTTTEAQESTTSQPAIIAIEIVDPNENSTTAKNSKRTIDSALGYGYNSYDTSKPRYEIYKYSQHDIPPYKGDSSVNTFKSSPINVQKSVQYSLPPVIEHAQSSSTSTALRPGTTLYSSLSAKGQVGGLTSSLAQIPELTHNHDPVPVVVLRIYPDQLKDSTIQANLPRSHPFAKVINSIDIQSLLLHYIKALQKGQQNTYSSGSYKTADNYQYQTPNYYSHNIYQRPVGYNTGSPKAETYQYYQQSYPQENNQYQEQQYSDYNNGVQIQEAPVKYQFSSTSQKQQPKKAEPARAQYYYVQPNKQTSYSKTPTQYYEQTYVQPSVPEQQYYSANEQQYQQYYQANEEQHQYASKTPKLLTTENYPTDKHTRVIFRTKTGNVRTPEQEETNSRAVKTINVHVPDNIAKVEVQETERPYYDYQQSYPEQSTDAPADPYDQEPSFTKVKVPLSYYLEQESVQEDYGKDSPADASYNYQNIDYDQMRKYFARRGAMPSYFYQSSEDEGSTENTGNMATAYEEAAFPSTTQEPEKKKSKSKKRT